MTKGGLDMNRGKTTGQLIAEGRVGRVMLGEEVMMELTPGMINSILGQVVLFSGRSVPGSGTIEWKAASPKFRPSSIRVHPDTVSYSQLPHYDIQSTIAYSGLIYGTEVVCYGVADSDGDDDGDDDAGGGD